MLTQSKINGTHIERGGTINRTQVWFNVHTTYNYSPDCNCSYCRTPFFRRLLRRLKRIG
jgi:hypothetical protein